MVTVKEVDMGNLVKRIYMCREADGWMQIGSILFEAAQEIERLGQELDNRVSPEIFRALRADLRIMRETLERIEDLANGEGELGTVICRRIARVLRPETALRVGEIHGGC